MSLYTHDVDGNLWKYDINPDGTDSREIVAVAPPPGVGQVAASDIISNALLEITALDLGGAPSSDEQAFCFSKLNRLFDNWGADRWYSYAAQLASFTLTPAHQPHTIGTSADLTVAFARPTKIEAANILTSGIQYPLNIRDEKWWARAAYPAQTGLPTDLYYNEAWPSGSIYLWPIPSEAFTINLTLWTPLAQFTDIDATFSMPPGYEDAVTLTLAESLCAPYSTQPPATLVRDAQNARTRIKSLNIVPLTVECDQSIAGRGYGLPNIYSGR